MGITQWDKDDQAMFDGCLAVDRAAGQADDPAGPRRPARTLRVLLTGVTGGDTETWCEADGAEVRGWYCLYLPSRENLDAGVLELVVDPGQRRLGLGTELLRRPARSAGGPAVSPRHRHRIGPDRRATSERRIGRQVILTAARSRLRR